MDQTDQTNIDSYINGMPVKSKEYLLPSAVGPIDLAAFEMEGRTPTIIQCERGEITHLLNIPNTTRVLNIDNNMIDNLPQDGVRQLKILSCNGNKLAHFDASNFTNLEELYLNGNQISELTNLPATLKTLEINDNPNLFFLDLGNATGLKKISCTGNDNLRKIVNVCQADKSGFIFKHDSHVEIEYVEKCRAIGKEKHQEHETATLDQYYALKQKYEATRTKEVRSIVAMPISTKNKKKLVRAIGKKCVNCGKTGGTEFWRKDDILYAQCAATSKCELNMKINAGFYSNVRDLMQITQDDMQEKRANIIRMKMDTLFNYMTEAQSAKQFKQDLEMYQGDEAMFNTYSDYEENIVNDPVRERLIKKKTHEIYRVLHDVRKMMDEYNKSGDKQVLHDAVEKQVSELHTEIEMLRTLKYPVMEMVNDTDVESIKHLRQMRFNPDLLDYALEGAIALGSD